MSRPARDLARSSRYYGDLLGLPIRGGFRDHDGYDGVFFGLPEGGELELTSGAVQPTGGTEEDLLVLYVPTLDAVRAVRERLEAAGVRPLPNANPYWSRNGATFLDPDGYRTVIAEASPNADWGGAVDIDWYDGPRAKLRPLFELAEDSRLQLDRYLGLGRVLVAQRGSDLVGHLQLVPTTRPGEIEVKNMAVVSEQRGAGVGRALMHGAVERCRAEGWSSLAVATAAADIGNLRFYQRLGFRLRAVDRDAFTAADGYPGSIEIDGIPLLDRVWLDQDLSVPRTDVPADRV